VQRFLITRTCSVCDGTRLRPEALTSQLGGRDIAEISSLSLGELRGFAVGLPAGLSGDLSAMTTGLLAEFDGRLTPLLDVGLGYLTLDRAGAVSVITSDFLIREDRPAIDRADLRDHRDSMITENVRGKLCKMSRGGGPPA
jgi:hypothetical protein